MARIVRTDEEKQSVGSFLREHRKSMGTSVRAIAERAEMSPQWVTSIESGKRALELQYINRVVIAYNVSAIGLLEKMGIQIDPVDDEATQLARKIMALSETYKDTVVNVVAGLAAAVKFERIGRATAAIRPPA